MSGATIRPGPEINEEIQAAELSMTINDGSAYADSTYEDGVLAALRWVTGDSPLEPITKEAAG